ncbi:ROK family protein [Companilactobacillus kimchii]|uniref:ROK family protein n=2 Tax=Companilactobacillus kimchii TaxID=2801452 RepID=A0ABR5NSG5_9LACO|nr:ROK family protein [Companilactobacillus kimchii]KAE9562250.1 hypothetical protein ATN91_06585 [Companilactobacillus kimchii]KRK51124.1 hypothetical protein FC97_GL000814 [Companilactobacillus kimchii DSM 13961 = JCM 10707]OWF34394.1 N-acetylglucosamine repressor [Companilactobacillus kimchii]GEO46317.1 hypothetical protein LKI01_03160 [Companilactobacillus paralimentarius]
MNKNIPELMRERNFNIIIQTIIQNGSLSSKKIADSTGLSVVSVNKLIKILTEKEIIISSSQKVSTGGRRAIQYTINSKNFNLLTIRILEVKQRMIAKLEIINLNGDTISNNNLQVEIVHPEDLLQSIEKMLQEQKIIPELIIIGTSGVESTQKMILSDVPGLSEVNLEQYLFEHTNITAKVINDVNAMVLGILKNNQEDNIVGIYYPKNYAPGVGLLISGNLVLGKSGAAGEISLGPSYKNTHYPMKQDVFEKYLLNDLQTMIALLDPDRIVVFAPDRKIDKNKLLKVLHGRIHQISETTIDFDKNIDQAYRNGLINYGREKIFEKIIKNI